MCVAFNGEREWSSVSKAELSLTTKEKKKTSYIDIYLVCFVIHNLYNIPYYEQLILHI